MLVFICAVDEGCNEDRMVSGNFIVLVYFLMKEM